MMMQKQGIDVIAAAPPKIKPENIIEELLYKDETP
jgi:hypothetical protein